MAKRSKRRLAQPQRNNVGCMWGLISLFDFRRGHPTQKLLSDKRHGSSRHTGTGYPKMKLSFRNSHETGTLIDEIRQDQACLGLTSVKELIEEEMFQSLIKKISMDETQRVTSSMQRDTFQKPKLIHGNPGKNTMAVSGSLDGIHSGIMDLTETSSLTFDIPALLLDLESYTGQQANLGSNDKFDLLPSLESTSLRSHCHLVEFGDSLDENISFVQNKLADFARIIAVQKSMIEGQNHGQLAVQPKKLMDQLYVTNSDKELFMKLLQDPDSFLHKFIQNLHDVQVKKTSKLGSERYSENVTLLVEENGNSGESNESDSNQSLQKQKRYNFFWRKDKLKATKQKKQNSSSEALNKIVVLRPNRVRSLNSSCIITPSSSPQSHHALKYNETGERIASNFSIKEIKRKIQQIFRESRQTRHVISMDGILHRIPVRSTDYGDLSELIHGGSAAASSVSHCCDVNKFPRSFDLDNISEKTISEEKFEVDGNSHISRSASRSESFIYEEARKHLAEMLDTRVDGLPRVQASEPLVKLLSLLDFNELSPASSPQRDEFAMSPKETGDSSLRHLDQGELAETSSLEVIYVSKDLNMEGNTEIIEMVDTKNIVDSNDLAIPLESSGSELIVVDEICEEESTISPGSDALEEKSLTLVQSKLRPSNIAGENLITLGSINEKPEQPSPVSVLEPFVSDDINSPDSADIDNYDNQVQHQQAVHEEGNDFVGIVESPDSNVRLRDYLQDYQARFDYVKAVLETSGLTNEFPRKWDMEDQLLEPSLFNEIGIFFCFLQDDPKLLFDCMNEVLLEIHERFLKCTPWLSFIKQNVLPVPLGGNLIHEVRKGLEWHLRIHLPNTLDQVVKKGLEGQCWIDLRFEAENITNKLCDAILDDVVKEIVCDSKVLNSEYFRIHHF